MVPRTLDNSKTIDLECGGYNELRLAWRVRAITKSYASQAYHMGKF